MSSHRIATIINFCTNDFRFLAPCIKEVKQFSSQILIPVCDHFFDGTPENRQLLQRAYHQHPDCEFIEFSYHPEQPYGLGCTKRQGDLDWSRHWHSTARMMGYYFLQEDIEYVLFIDVDEIYEGVRFQHWLDGFDYRSYNALRFLSYNYFREARYRAKEPFTSGILTKRNLLTPEILLNVDERLGIYNQLPEKKVMYLNGMDGLPMIHHYSWVRTKEEMLKKVASWAHHWEKDWKSLVEKEFSSSFSGKDFMTNFDYLSVDPYIDPFEDNHLFSEAPISSPTYRTTPQDILQRDFALKLRSQI